ncbi:hypothetical protein DIPPA_12302 [Diplonema papillatum]|nr:hypothetical protein DIPPA_12302 [Diplonema papillatum]
MNESLNLSPGPKCDDDNTQYGRATPVVFETQASQDLRLLGSPLKPSAHGGRGWSPGAKSDGSDPDRTPAATAGGGAAAAAAAEKRPPRLAAPAPSTRAAGRAVAAAAAAAPSLPPPPRSTPPTPPRSVGGPPTPAAADASVATPPPASTTTTAPAASPAAPLTPLENPAVGEEAPKPTDQKTGTETPKLAEQKVEPEAPQFTQQNAEQEAPKLAEQNAEPEAPQLTQNAEQEAPRLAEQNAEPEAPKLAEQNAEQEEPKLAEQKAEPAAPQLTEQNAEPEAPKLAEQNPGPDVPAATEPVERAGDKPEEADSSPTPAALNTAATKTESVQAKTGGEQATATESEQATKTESVQAKTGGEQATATESEQATKTESVQAQAELEQAMKTESEQAKTEPEQAVKTESEQATKTETQPAKRAANGKKAKKPSAKKGRPSAKRSTAAKPATPRPPKPAEEIELDQPYPAGTVVSSRVWQHPAVGRVLGAVDAGTHWNYSVRFRQVKKQPAYTLDRMGFQLMSARPPTAEEAAAAAAEDRELAEKGAGDADTSTDDATPTESAESRAETRSSDSAADSASQSTTVDEPRRRPPRVSGKKAKRAPSAAAGRKKPRTAPAAPLVVKKEAAAKQRSGAVGPSPPKRRERPADYDPTTHFEVGETVEVRYGSTWSLGTIARNDDWPSIYVIEWTGGSTSQVHAVLNPVRTPKPKKPREGPSPVAAKKTGKKSNSKAAGGVVKFIRAGVQDPGLDRQPSYEFGSEKDRARKAARASLAAPAFFAAESDDPGLSESADHGDDHGYPPCDDSLLPPPPSDSHDQGVLDLVQPVARKPTRGKPAGGETPEKPTKPAPRPEEAEQVLPRQETPGAQKAPKAGDRSPPPTSPSADKHRVAPDPPPPAKKRAASPPPPAAAAAAGGLPFKKPRLDDEAAPASPLLSRFASLLTQPPQAGPTLVNRSFVYERIDGLAKGQLAIATVLHIDTAKRIVTAATSRVEHGLCIENSRLECLPEEQLLDKNEVLVRSIDAKDSLYLVDGSVSGNVANRFFEARRHPAALGPPSIAEVLDDVDLTTGPHTVAVRWYAVCGGAEPRGNENLFIPDADAPAGPAEELPHHAPQMYLDDGGCPHTRELYSRILRPTGCEETVPLSLLSPRRVDVVPKRAVDDRRFYFHSTKKHGQDRLEHARYRDVNFLGRGKSRHGKTFFKQFSLGEKVYGVGGGVAYFKSDGSLGLGEVRSISVGDDQLPVVEITDFERAGAEPDNIIVEGRVKRILAHKITSHVNITDPGRRPSIAGDAKHCPVYWVMPTPSKAAP